MVTKNNGIKMTPATKIYQGAVILILLFSFTIFGQVRLPKLISDGMVLQREADVKIWGFAASDEKIAVKFIDSNYETIADSSGNWEITISNLKAGGPYSMDISSSNSITINNILIGDVWICSGQSNMELSMARVSPLYATEIANADYPFIRYFQVPKKYYFNSPQKDLVSGNWQTVNSESILSISATSYFFAQELYDKYEIPIGIINTSLGGSPAEAWISEDAIKEFPKHYKEIQRFKDPALISQIENNDRTRSNMWYSKLSELDEGYKNKSWFSSELNTSDWSTMMLPGFWANEAIGKVNGVVWFKKEIQLPANVKGKSAKLLLGRIVDADSVFVNGIFVGSTSYQYPPRRYEISPDILKEGKNIITIRVISNSGNGGFVINKPYELICGEQTIDLKGEWKYKLGAKMEPLQSQTFIRWKPVGLYNAMISPLLNYSISGVVWYQGESNTNRPKEYVTLFSTLINNWRDKFNQGNFPFIYVQLPNFMEPMDEPSESNWALTREAQLKALMLPNTAMAVAIDIGEGNDIHPLNKKDVGYRLALAAEKIAYNENVVHSGPIYKSMEVDGNKIILSFSNIGSGLKIKGNEELKYFAIAGADKKFVWAEAKIENSKIIVWSDKIKNPVTVRYAWANNPEGANLYNNEGLPASPFRTDKWESNNKMLQK